MAEEEKKDLLGSETIDKIYSYLGDTTQSIYQRAQEDDPTSLTDEAARLGVGTAEFVGNVAGAPVIKQTLQALDLPFYLLRQGTGGVLEHGFGVDPRVGHLAVGTAEVFVGGKGLVSGATKGAKLARKGAFASRYAVQETIDAARAARLARKGKFWRSPDAGKMSPLDDAWKPGDITGPKKTYTQTAPRTAYPDPKGIPPDPWVDLSDFKMKLEDSIDNPLYRNVDDLSLVDEVLAAGDDVIYPPGSQEARIQAQYQASRQVPSGMTPQQTRGWFAKFPRPRIFEIGEELGGSPKELRRIAKEQVDEFNDMENTISELNHMWRVWAEGRSLGFENSQVVVKKMKDGTERLAIEAWKGSDKHWKTFAAFNKDHIRAVINANLPGGGLYGANMAANLEAIFAAANRRKSNLFQLDEKILKNIGVPKNAETYIFRKLHPQYTELERLIPPFWRESYVKNILNDYYEAIWNAKAKKWKLTGKKRNAKMNQLVRKYTHLYRDKAFIEGLEGLQKDLDKLMQSNIAKRISGKQIPEWMENLTMPPGGFKSKDPWWLDLPIDARRRWRRLADQKRIRLKYDPEYRPSKGRYRIQPDD